MRPLGTLLLIALLSLASSPPALADYIDHFADPDDIGLLKVPRHGTTRVLVIPLIIEDLPFEQDTEEAFLAEVEAFYDPGATGWAFTPYWTTASLGRFTPQATVAQPVRFTTCPTIGEYEDCAIPRGAGFATGDSQGAIAVLVDAITFMDQVMRCATDGDNASCRGGGDVDMRDFDTSGPTNGQPDGVADGVIVVSNAGFPGIALPVKDLATQPLLQIFGPFPALEYDGVVVGAVAVAGFQGGAQRAVWVSVHEFGHLLGWADLYNEFGTTTDMPYTLMGGWFYRDPGSLPDAYSRMAAGFAHVIQTSGNATFTIGPADATGTVLKVGGGDELFLVELRRETPAIDGDMTEPFGVVVERVRFDEEPSPEHGAYLNTLSECVNCIELDPFLAIEQADGQFELERNFPRDDDEDLFLAGAEIGPSDDVEPRTIDHLVFSTNRIDGTPTGIRIRVAEVDAEHAVVEIEAPAIADGCAEIERYCQGQPCLDGPEGTKQCGEFVPPLVLPPDPPGCPCNANTTSQAWPASSLALLALVGTLLRRRRR